MLYIPSIPCTYCTYYAYYTCCSYCTYQPFLSTYICTYSMCLICTLCLYMYRMNHKLPPCHRPHFCLLFDCTCGCWTDLVNGIGLAAQCRCRIHISKVGCSTLSSMCSWHLIVCFSPIDALYCHLLQVSAWFRGGQKDTERKTIQFGRELWSWCPVAARLVRKPCRPLVAIPFKMALMGSCIILLGQFWFFLLRWCYKGKPAFLSPVWWTVDPLQDDATKWILHIFYPVVEIPTAFKMVWGGNPEYLLPGSWNVIPFEMVLRRGSDLSLPG